MLAWISAHITDRVFEPDSVDSYVDYLKRLGCISPGSNNSRHAGKRDEKKIYGIKKAEAGYIIFTGPDVVSREFSGHLPRILVVDERAAVLRAAERLETTYLATGSIETAWAACAHRADFETMCVEQDEFSLQPGAHAHLRNGPTQFTSATNAANLCCARTTRQNEGLVFRSSALIVSPKCEGHLRSREKEIECDSAASSDVPERLFEI